MKAKFSVVLVHFKSGLFVLLGLLVISFALGLEILNMQSRFVSENLPDLLSPILLMTGLLMAVAGATLRLVDSSGPSMVISLRAFGRLTYGTLVMAAWYVLIGLGRFSRLRQRN